MCGMCRDKFRALALARVELTFWKRIIKYPTKKG